MILWKSKEDSSDIKEYMTSSAFRWTFQINKFDIGFVHQYKSKSTGEWFDSHTVVVQLYLTKHFAFGSAHIWYDGPHCIFSLGYLHFIYSGLNQGCKHCSGEK